MITLTNILNETSRAVLKVIQGPLAGFSYKSWRMRMQLMLDPFFPAWGLVLRSAGKSEEKMGPELDYALTETDFAKMPFAGFGFLNKVNSGTHRCN